MIGRLSGGLTTPLAVFYVVLWASAYVPSKIGATAVAPMWFLVARFLVAGMVMAAIAVALRRPFPARRTQWLVYAADPRMATAIVDQQMMLWLMSSNPQWDYELADGWLMVMREDLRASPSQYELQPVLEALLAFREHIPRAANSLFGPQDPT